MSLLVFYFNFPTFYILLGATTSELFDFGGGGVGCFKINIEQKLIRNQILKVKKYLASLSI